MDSTQFDILNKKMDVLIGLLTHNITKDQTVQEKVKLLDSLGLKQKQIANILGKTERNISVNLQRIRKSKKKEDNN